MRLSQEVLTGLKRAGNPSLVSDENFDRIINEISKYMEYALNPDHVVAIPTTQRVDVIKECYACLLIFLIEWVRWKEGDSTLKNILYEQKFPEDRINKVLRMVEKQKIPLELTLSQFNSDPPHVFDVSWKISYCVKSSFSEYDGKALYFIKLCVAKRKTILGKPPVKSDTEIISFVCTVNQLQSLVASLKAALRHLESIAESSK